MRGARGADACREALDGDDQIDDRGLNERIARQVRRRHRPVVVSQRYSAPQAASLAQPHNIEVRLHTLLLTGQFRRVALQVYWHDLRQFVPSESQASGPDADARLH